MKTDPTSIAGSDANHELDRLLATGKFVAIGESPPYMPYPWDKTALVSRVDAIANILRIVEVAHQHDVAARIHTGIPYGYTAAYSYGYIGPRTSTRCGCSTSRPPSPTSR